MIFLGWAVSSLLLLGSAAAPPVAPPITDPLLVLQELDRLADQPLWPGFDPGSYPVAIYDGERTWLFGHPEPPDEFTQSAEHPGAWVHSGRHPRMRSNSKAAIGDVTTATLLLTIEPGRSAQEEAAILVHETFHVFQDTHHPAWTANEAHRFTYPVGDVNNYRRSIEEDHALGRALQAADPAVAASWAARAMIVRAERVAALAVEHRQFELGLEMMEGTAFYLAHLAVGQADSTERLLQILPPEKFRWRFYATGGAIAALLDRFDPDWKLKLGSGLEPSLEQLLGRYVESAGIAPASFSDDEMAVFLEQATTALGRLHLERAEHRERFERPDVYRVRVVVADGMDPFTTSRFDVVNVLNLGGGDVLHGHRLVLTGPAGKIEMENPGFVRRSFVGLNALTSVAAGHPLFGEVRGVAFVGFADQPRITVDGETVSVVADGLQIDLLGATLERSERSLAITAGERPRGDD